MNTASKLWIGFGTLSIILLVICVAILARVRPLEAHLAAMAQARSLTAHTRELEINVLAFALEVRAYAHGERNARIRARRGASSVHEHLAKYRALAQPAAQNALAARFASQWQSVYQLGERLLNTEPPLLTNADSQVLQQLTSRLEQMLDSEMQIDAEQAYLASQESALADVRYTVNFVLVLLLSGALVAGLTGAAVVRDIVNSERALRDNREMLRVTLASIGDAVIATDVQGRVTFLNAVAEALTGWSQVQAAGVSLEQVFRIVNEATHAVIENPALRAIREGKVVGLTNHTILISKNDKQWHIDDSAAPIRDARGRVSGVVLIFRDVSARRAMEKRSEAARLYAESVVATVREPLLVLGAELTVHSASRSFYELFRVTQLDTEGRFFYEIGAAEWNQPNLRAQLERVLADNLPMQDVEVETEFPGLGTRIMLLNARKLLQAPAAQPLMLLAIADITERKQAENALRELSAELSEADRRKNEFLAMLAHELRNPLAPIRNAVQLLRLTAAEHPGVQSTAEMMERQVTQMVRLVDDLLDVSRVSRGKIELRFERTALAACVQHAVEAVRSLARHMGHELLINTPAEPIYLMADPARLTQIIGNLLNNACKFTDLGGRIELSVAVQEQHALIRISDNGIGIAREHLPSIFEMFRQLDASLERSTSGLGIGLTLVKSLVEMHQGSISARSAGVGQGAEFEARLPLWAERSAPDELAKSGAAQHMPAQRILVVDDNRDAAASLAMLLNLSGNQAYLAHDGLEAFAQAQALLPQIILLDIGLPKLNGFEVARKIRAEAWGASVILIALTGWGTEEDRQKSRNSGFDEHLVKPVDYPTLTRRLQELVAERAAPRDHLPLVSS